MVAVVVVVETAMLKSNSFDDIVGYISSESTWKKLA